MEFYLKLTSFDLYLPAAFFIDFWIHLASETVANNLTDDNNNKKDTMPLPPSFSPHSFFSSSEWLQKENFHGFCIDLVLWHRIMPWPSNESCVEIHSNHARFACIVLSFFLSFSTLNTVHIHYVKSQCQTVCRCSFCVRIVGMCMCFCSPCFTALFCATKTINLSVDNFWRLNLILMMSTNEKMFNNYRKQLTWTLMRHEKEMPKSENATTS